MSTQIHSEQTPSPPDPLRKPNDNHVAWLLRRIWDRVNRKNKHFMGVIVGEEGSGKSYTAIKIANTVDPSFNAERVMFDVGQLLEVLKDGDHEPGNFYVLDEAGVQLGRRTWQDRAQVLANQALQLVRDHNLGLVFTLPRLSELDSQAQGRLQAFLELIDMEDGEYVVGKWKWMDPDRADNTGTIYKKYPRRRINGNVRRITRMAFRPPGEDITAPYNERKREFQEEFYQEVIDQLAGETEDEATEDLSPSDLAEQVEPDDLDDILAPHGTTGEPLVKWELIRAKYDMSQKDAKAAKTMIEKQYDTEDLAEAMDQ